MIHAALSPCLRFQNNFTFGSNFWNLPKSTFQIYPNFKTRNPAEYSDPPGLSAGTVPFQGCLWLPIPPHTHCAYMSQEMEACVLHGLEIELGCFCEGMSTHYSALPSQKARANSAPSLPPFSIWFVRNRAQIRASENPPGHNTQELSIALVPPRKTLQQ